MNGFSCKYKRNIYTKYNLERGKYFEGLNKPPLKNPRCHGDFSLSDEGGFPTLHESLSRGVLENLKVQRETKPEEANCACKTHILKEVKK